MAVPTTIIDMTVFRWDPTDFDEYVEVSPKESETSSGDHRWHFTLNPEANPPPDKFHALMESNPKFKLSWERKRKDFPSQSEYDLSLTSMALNADLTAQEIVDLVIAHRRKWNQDPKLRDDYYRRLLDKAAQGRHLEDLESLADTLRGKDGLSTETRVEKATIRETLSKYVGDKIGKVVKLTPPPCTYQIVINGTAIPLGGVDTLDSQTKFRRVLMDATGKQLQDFNKRQWRSFKDLFLAACEEISAGPEADRWEGFKLGIRSFLYTTPPSSVEDWQEACLNHDPFQKDGKTYISSQKLGHYLLFYTNEKWSQRQVAIRLREIGAISRNMSVNHKEINTSRTVWELPPLD